MAYQSNLGYDPDVQDYSAAIAKEQDAGRRQELLRQRQNKLDHLSGQGKVDPNWSSNRVVSGWTESYQPGGWNDATASYNGYDTAGTPYSGGLSAVRGGSVLPAPQSLQSLQTEQTRQLEQAAAAQQRALEAAINTSVRALEGQRSDVEADYSAMARQAYINYMRSREALPAALSTGGLSGGASESALAALDVSYQENLYQSDLARRGSLDAIDAAVGQVRAQGSIEKAQAAAEQARQLADALQKQASALLEQSRWEQQFSYNSAQDSADRAAQLAAQQRSEQQERYRRQLELAKILAASGDFSGYRDLGVDTAAMEAAWAERQAEAAAKLAGTAGSASKGSTRSGSSSAGKSAADAAPVAEEAPATVFSTTATDEDLLRAQEVAKLVRVVKEERLSPVERAAVTYIEDLAVQYASNTTSMHNQVEDDFAKGFVSRELAEKALGLLGGDWRVGR